MLESFLISTFKAIVIQMEHILKHLNLPWLQTAQSLQQLKIQFDTCLPEDLHDHYCLSQDSNQQLVILVRNSLWIMQLRNFEPKLRSIATHFFQKPTVLKWKIRPKINL